MLTRRGVVVIGALAVAAITAGVLMGGAGPILRLVAPAAPLPQGCHYLIVDGYDSLADAFRGQITIDAQSFSFDATDLIRPRTFTFKGYGPGAHAIASIVSFDTQWPRRSIEYAGELPLGDSVFYRLRWPKAAGATPPRPTALSIAPTSESEVREVLGESFATLPRCENAGGGISHTR